MKKSQQTPQKNTGSKQTCNLALRIVGLCAAIVIFLTCNTSQDIQAKPFNHAGYEIEPMSNVPKYPGSLSSQIGALFAFPKWLTPVAKHSVSPLFKNTFTKNNSTNRSELGLHLEIKNFSFAADNPGLFIDFSTKHAIGSRSDHHTLEPYYLAQGELDLNYIYDFLKLNFGVDSTQVNFKEESIDKEVRVTFSSGLAIAQDDNISLHFNSNYHRFFRKSYSKPAVNIIENWLYADIDFESFDQNIKIGPLFHHSQSFFLDRLVSQEFKVKSLMAKYKIEPLRNIVLTLASNYVIHANKEIKRNLNPYFATSHFNGEDYFLFMNTEDSFNIDASLNLGKLYKNISIDLKYQNQISNLTKKNEAKRSYRENYAVNLSYSVGL